MGIKEEVQEMKNEVKSIKTQSFAMELLKDARKTNKRIFIIWIITFVAFISLLGYTVWLLNDIGTTTESIEVQDVETIDNSHIKIGDDVWEKSQ